MYKVLIENEFINDFLNTLDKAKDHIELQFMSFEADSAGMAVEKILLKKAKEGVRIRLIIDKYSTLYISQKHRNHHSVREEYERTKKMFRTFEQYGIAVRWTAPLGILNLSLIRRNHKKIICIDNHSYLCGYNISDHNFEWHDYGVKMDGQAAKDILYDFDSTWDELHRPDRGTIITDQKKMRDFVVKSMRDAEREILITSAYVYDVHMLPLLARTAKRGIKVILITPEHTNIRSYQWVKDFATNYLLEHNVNVVLYPSMTHAKGILIDRRLAIFGSSNYGEHSHLTHKEIIMHSKDKELIRQLYHKLFLPDIKKSKPARMTPKLHFKQLLVITLLHGGMKLSGRIWHHHRPNDNYTLSLKRFWKQRK